MQPRVCDTQFVRCIRSEIIMELIVALSLTFFSLIVLYILLDISKSPDFPPGPNWFPLVGCFPQFILLKSRLKYLHLVWDKLARQYGPLVGLRVNRELVVLVSGHDAVKHVLATDNCNGRPDGFFFRMRTFNKVQGLVFLEGEKWQKHRHFTMLHLRQLGLGRDGMESLISTETQALVDMLKEKCQSIEGTELPLHNLCGVSVINTLWTVVAGQRYELSDPRLQNLLDLNNTAFKNVDLTGGIVNNVPWIRFIAPEISGYNTLKNSLQGITQFLKLSVEEHKMTFDPEHTRDLMDKYIKEIYAQKDDPDTSFTEEQLLSVCLDLFMAGSETTSSQMGFFILLIMHHPNVQAKIQKEIDSVVGRDRLPNFTDRPLLPYLNSTIMEMQRITAIVPNTPHKTMKNCKILGYKIPKNTILIVSLWSVHMDEDHWGDPHVFRPERFLDETAQNVIKDEWLMPFGTGKRRCLAEELAKSNLYFFFAALLQNFTFEVVPGETPSLTPLDGSTFSPQPFTGIIKLR